MSPVAPLRSPLIASTSSLLRPQHEAEPTSLLAPPPAKLLELRQNTYLTLTVTQAYLTYTTTILLGDTFPTSPPPGFPAASAYPAAAQSSPQVETESETADPQTQNPGLGSGTTAGIIVGCILAFILLLGVGYVFLLRARQRRRRRRRRKKRRKSASSAGGGPPPAGPPPGPGPGPPPAPEG